jgi:hypothetical protein
MAALAKFDRDRETIALTKYMQEPCQSCFTSFQLPDKPMPKHVFGIAHLVSDAISSLAMICLMGFVVSMGFLASLFPMCPFTSTSTHQLTFGNLTRDEFYGTATVQVGSILSLWLVFIGTASTIGFHDPELMSKRWYGFVATTLFLATVGIRSAVEFGSQGKWHALVYVVIMGVCLILGLPVIQSVARLTGEPNYPQMEKWSRETWRKMRPLLKTEFSALTINTLTTGWIIFIPLVDCIVFLNPNSSMSAETINWVRPISLFAMRRSAYHFYCRGALKMTRLASFKMMTLVAIYIGLGSIHVRTASGMNTWDAFFNFVLCDWQ